MVPTPPSPLVTPRGETSRSRSTESGGRLDSLLVVETGPVQRAGTGRDIHVTHIPQEVGLLIRQPSNIKTEGGSVLLLPTVTGETGTCPSPATGWVVVTTVSVREIHVSDVSEDVGLEVGPLGVRQSRRSLSESPLVLTKVLTSRSCVGSSRVPSALSPPPPVTLLPGTVVTEV